MTEKQIECEQRRLTSHETASGPTQSFEHSLRNGIRGRLASPFSSTTTPPGEDRESISRTYMFELDFEDVESAQRCWQRSHTQLGRRVARLFDGQFWIGTNRL